MIDPRNSLRVLPNSSYRQMPWANGKGTTTEIEIYPPSAKLEQRNFLWRLSSAEVSGKGAFSNFAGYNRLLTILRGDRLRLDHQELSFGEVLRFRGEQEFRYDTGENKIADFGIIYSRDQVSADLQIIRDLEQGFRWIDLKVGVHYFYLAVGDSQFGDQKLFEGDTLCFEVKQPTKIALTTKAFSIVFWSTLEFVPQELGNL